MPLVHVQAVQHRDALLLLQVLSAAHVQTVCTSCVPAAAASLPCLHIIRFSDAS